MNEESIENGYLAGKRMVYIRLLRLCMEELGIDTADGGQARWALERAEVVQQLRVLCAEHECNDWPDDLHLADVIEKYVARMWDDELHRL